MTGSGAVAVLSCGCVVLSAMSELRNKAIAAKAEVLRLETAQLERISRHQPRVSRLAGEARRNLAAVEDVCDCALTSREEDELYRRSCSGDEDALAELTRRQSVAA